MRTLTIHFGIVCLLMPAAMAQLPVPPAKVTRYAMSVMERYDANGDGVLQRDEWEMMPGTPRAMDRDGDGQISLDELVWYFAYFGQGRTIHRTVLPDLRDPYRFDRANTQVFRPLLPPTVPTPPSTAVQDEEEDAMEVLMKEHDQAVDEEVYLKLLDERLVSASRPYHVFPEHLKGVPAWFLILDKNGDGQISLAEFAPTPTLARLRLFRQLDKNGNSFIEPHEARNP
ncbi:MAG: EF-hand domain-containing protein [Planctomycetaceae bacterium]|nr:EF-hand domain-containing protein [Planctomycetaceae bacterium]